MAAYSYDVFKNILYQASYVSDGQRAALTSLARFDEDADASNGIQITYSFMKSVPDYFATWGIQGFSTPTAELQTAIRGILGSIDLNTQIDFIEVDDSHYATMKLGMYSTRSGLPSTANDAEGFPGGLYATKGSSGWIDIASKAGEAAGDAFFTQSVLSKGLSPGNSGYAIVLHELLHSLGFKHPSSPSPALTSDLDNTKYTVMSYNGNYNFTQPAVLDAIALHYMYGTPYGIGDDGWLTGTSTSINNMFSGGNGKTLDGGSGIDTVSYTGNSSASSIKKDSSGNYIVSSPSTGTDTLTNIERIKFADKTIALDTEGNGGQAYRVYQAAFNRKPDASGLGFWINSLDKGASLVDVSNGFINSAEFQSQYGTNPTVADFVNKLYQNVLHRAGEPSGVAYWHNELNTGHQTKAQVLAGFSDSTENKAAVIGVIQNGFEYTPYL